MIIPANIAVLNFPPLSHKTPSPIQLEGEEEYLENRYGIATLPSWRALFVRFTSEVTPELHQIERVGLVVSTATLMHLQEGRAVDWSAHYQGQRFTLRVTPSQQVLSKITKIIPSQPFESALKEMLEACAVEQ